MPIPLLDGAPLLGQGPTPGMPPAPPPEASLEIDIDETGAVPVREQSAPAAAPKPANFDDNLAEALDAAALGSLAEDLLRGIEADERSRREMVEQRECRATPNGRGRYLRCSWTARSMRSATSPIGCSAAITSASKGPSPTLPTRRMPPSARRAPTISVASKAGRSG
jgi:hypothetical protein